MPKDYPDYYPQKVNLRGNGIYNKGKIIADLSAKLDDISRVKVKGNFELQSTRNLSSRYKIIDLELAKWLQDSLSFNKADIDISIKGKGLKPEEMNTEAEVSIRNFSYIENEFDTLNLSASIIERELDF